MKVPRLIEGDCLVELPKLTDAGERYHAVITDPPYHLGEVPHVKRGGFGGERSEERRAARSGFMGKQWDGGDIAFRSETWRAVFDALLPGGHLVCFGGTRTWHRMACAIEDAGFEMRDTLCWLYGSGFSKSGLLKNRQGLDWCECDEETSERDVRPVWLADVSAPVNADDQCGQVLFAGMSQQSASEHGATRSEPKASRSEQSSVEGRQLHRAGQGLSDGIEAGPSEGATERLRAGAYPCSGTDAGPPIDADRGSASSQPRSSGQQAGQPTDFRQSHGTLDDGALPGRGACPRCGKFSRQFEGFSTALKPAWEPIILARKPLVGTVAANVLAHGTGALNVDACRVGTEGATKRSHTEPYGEGGRADQGGTQAWRTGHAIVELNTGRWPANVVLSPSGDEYELRSDVTDAQRRELFGWFHENA